MRHRQELLEHHGKGWNTTRFGSKCHPCRRKEIFCQTLCEEIKHCSVYIIRQEASRVFYIHSGVSSKDPSDVWPYTQNGFTFFFFLFLLNITESSLVGGLIIYRDDSQQHGKINDFFFICGG